MKKDIDFRPQKGIEIISMHPAALLREVTPLPLITRIQRVPGMYSDLQKAVEMAADGWKVRVLMGGKAAEQVLGYGSNTGRWRGHFTLVKGKL